MSETYYLRHVSETFCLQNITETLCLHPLGDTFKHRGGDKVSPRGEPALSVERVCLHYEEKKLKKCDIIKDKIVGSNRFSIDNAKLC